MPFDSKYISTQNLDTFGESLVNVDLSNNVIVGELPSDSFTSNTQLFSIDLSGNQLSGNMKSGTFSSNNRLSTLVLSGNDLDHVETSCFPSSLTTLDISHNKITSLETDAFLVGNSLEVLDLSGNKLESIGGGLDFSDVSGNKEWSHLRSLNVSFNSIASVEANAFAGLTNIEQISIQKNHVATIQGTAFRGCTKLKEIDLSGNQLEETLAMGIFENLPALRVITLVGNVVTADTLVVGTLGNNKLLIGGKVTALYSSYGCTLNDGGKKLDCSNGKLLTSAAVPQFRDLPSTITSIDFSNNNLIEFDVTSLGCSSCGENSNSLTGVESLNLAGNKLIAVPTVSLQQQKQQQCIFFCGRTCIANTPLPPPIPSLCPLILNNIYFKLIANTLLLPSLPFAI